MSRKTKIVLLVVAAAAVAAAILAALWMRRGESAAEPETAIYDRMKNPEYLKMLENEKAAQRKTMGEIARARQNLEEAKEAKLEPEIIKELEDAVAEAEKNLELDRARMRDNLRRELWKEQHPEHVKTLDEYRAREAATMAEIEAAKKRLADAEAEGAGEDRKAALKAELDALVKKLAENHNTAEQTLRSLGGK